jgi:hemoglobin
MVGFLFQASSVSRERIKEKEYEFAAQHLGGAVEYTGRPLQAAHRKHTIMTGQFMRRLQILKETLEEFEVPEQVRQHWVRHTLEQMPLITSADNGKCEPPASRGGA